MHRFTLAAGVALAALSAASPALAANLGYVQLGAIGGVEQELYDSGYQYDFNSLALDGAARFTVPIADPFSLQLDIWASSKWVSYTSCYQGSCSDPYKATVNSGAFATHLAYALDQGTIGGLVSTNGEWATAALEAATQLGNVRLYGQVGVSRVIYSYNQDYYDEYEETDVFATGVLAYYIDPNLSVSVNAGIDSYNHWESSPGYSFEETQFRTSWGARIEKRFEGTQLSAYLAYQGRSWSGESTNNGQPHNAWTNSQHALLAGLRFALGGDGSETLQDLDNAVGLVDLNPVYGDGLVGTWY